MKVQRSYKEHYDLYTEILDSIAVNRFQIELAQMYIILLSEVSILIYDAGKRTGVENAKFIHFSLSAGTYFLDYFNAKVKQGGSLTTTTRLETTSN